MKNVLCNNFNSKTPLWHVLVAKDNLTGIKALIDSKLCNIHQLDDNSLIIEAPAILETMQQVQEIYRKAVKNDNYKITFADQYNYSYNFTV